MMELFLIVTGAVFIGSLAKDAALAWYVSHQTKKIRKKELGKLEEIRSQLMRRAVEEQDEPSEPASD